MWLAFLIVSVFLAFSLLVYLFAVYPKLGRNPNLIHQQKLQKSPNFKNGKFYNLVETPIITTDSQISLLFNNLFCQPKTQIKPAHKIPSIQTDLTKLPENSIVWLGHSSYFINLNGQKFLLDPIFSECAAPISIAIKSFAGSNLYKPSDFAQIDGLIITHDHYDHLDYKTVKALEPKVKQVITTLGVSSHLTYWNLFSDQICELDWHQSTQIGEQNSVTLTAVPVRHFSGRTFHKNRTLWAGFILQTQSFKIFFSGDSGYGQHFAQIGKKYGPFDWVTLDSGQYNKSWQNVHMTPEQSAKAAFELGAKNFTPQHLARFALSSHTWDEPFYRFQIACQNYSYNLLTPMIGQPIDLAKLNQQTFSPWWQINQQI